MLIGSYSKLLLLGFGLLTAGALVAKAAEPGLVERVSVSPTEQEGFGNSTGPVGVSADGNLVAFASTSSNFFGFLDSNGVSDIFVRNRTTGFTEMVTLGNPTTTAGQRVVANGPSAGASISDDGRYVAFHSSATNLVTGDANARTDAFIRDRQGDVYRASVTAAGAEVNGNSTFPTVSAPAFGDVTVAYTSDATNVVTGDANAVSDVFVTTYARPFLGGGTLQLQSVVRASTSASGTEANGASGQAMVSGDGQYVVFASDADNLIATDDNGVQDVFVKDLLTGDVELISQDDLGELGDGPSYLPSISYDGRYVAFISEASNFALDDANGFADVFVRDRLTQTTFRVSVNTDGTEGDDVSGPDSTTANLPTNGVTGRPSISFDGSFVAFTSDATTLVDDDFNLVTDAFLYNVSSGETTRVSVSSEGLEGDDASTAVAISTDGSVVAFESAATTLVADDTNFSSDIFTYNTGISGGVDEVPIADAGFDTQVFEGDTVVLDGTGSFDPEGFPLTYTWVQLDTGGPLVTLDDPNSPTPSFVAPLVSDFETLDFELVVSDGVNVSDPALVSVEVDAAPFGQLTGEVVDGGGSSVVGASVQVIRVDGEEATEGFTDGGGRYFIDDVRVGDNIVIVSAPGFEPVVLDGDDVVSVGSLELVQRDFILENFTGQLAGEILLADGTPLDGATVDLLDADNNVLLTDDTDSAGEYSLPDLSGSIIAQATALRITHPALVDWVVTGLNLEAGTLNQRNFRYGNLEVTVDGNPRKLRKQLNGTEVQILMGDQPVAENSASKKVRKLRFLNVPAGLLRVRAINPNLTGAQTTVNVAPGKKFTKVTINLRPRGIF